MNSKFVLTTALISLLFSFGLTTLFAQGSTAQEGRQIQDRDQVGYDDNEQTGPAIRNQEGAGAPESVEGTNSVSSDLPATASNAKKIMTQTNLVLDELQVVDYADNQTAEEVKELVAEQKKVQLQISEQMNKLEARQGFLKTILGPDHKAIKAMNQQIEKNQVAVQKLQQLLTQVKNQAEETALKSAIHNMTDQNTALQDRIKSEEKMGSLLGWFFKLINN